MNMPGIASALVNNTRQNSSSVNGNLDTPDLTSPDYQLLREGQEHLKIFVKQNRAASLQDTESRREQSSGSPNV